MIKPSDIVEGPRYTTEDLASVEKDFDAAIKNAATLRRWPAKVPSCRDMIPNAAVEEMMRRYREIGWTVTLSQDKDTLCVIQRPTNPAE